MSKEFLLEIGCEEIPSDFIQPALAEFRERTTKLLSEARISASEVKVYATPRRWVVYIPDLPDHQEAFSEEILGPAKSIAYDAEGKPTRAALGFAKSQGMPVSALAIKRTPKGEYVSVLKTQKSQPTQKILQSLLPRLIGEIQFPKTMRWEGDTRFARPVRWMMALYRGKIVPFRYAGLSSGNRSFGHRLISDRAFTVRDFKPYIVLAKRHGVIVDQEERTQLIRRGLLRWAQSLGGRVLEDEELLTQATYMTEYPVVLRGSFPEDYLKLPSEVLITAMKEHQGYFSVIDRSGKLLPFFLCVINTKAKDTDMIRRGHERVLRARLEDARFYFEQDQKRPLAERTADLKGLTFQDRLGTMAEKTERLEALCISLSQIVDPQWIGSLKQAARLCKTDLLTGMVREFPNLQGIMGREYALHHKQPEAVAYAIAEHYLPRYGGDILPKTLPGKILAVSDKLDTLVGCFGIGLAPTGSQDPYGLRRSGLGLIRILIDNAFIKVSLGSMIDQAIGLYKEKLTQPARKLKQEVLGFLAQRMDSYLRTQAASTAGDPAAAWFLGEFRGDLAEAVLSRPLENPLDVYQRFLALVQFHKSDEFEPLMLTFKRATRIIPAGFTGAVDAALLKEKEELDLHAASHQSFQKMVSLMAGKKYPDALAELCRLRQPIDRFFDKVLVMDENRLVRENRLAILKAIGTLFEQFADFSRIVVATHPSG
jgi:glycyl-tRNA synthetase beta chain